MGGDDFVDALQKFNGNKQTFDEAKAELEEYLENLEAINYSQRIILLAEQFDPKVLFAAEWLSEKYKVNIRCYRLTLARQSNDEFLEAADEAVLLTLELSEAWLYEFTFLVNYDATLQLI